MNQAELRERIQARRRNEFTPPRDGYLLDTGTGQWIPMTGGVSVDIRDVREKWWERR